MERIQSKATAGDTDPDLFAANEVTPTLEDYRALIDALDRQLLALLVTRMEVVRQVAVYKHAHKLPVLHPTREQQLLAARTAEAPAALQPYAADFFSHLMDLSKSYQRQILEELSIHVERDSL